MTPGERSRARLAGVDVLRLIAVLLVLGRHMWLPPETWSAATRGFFAAWQRGGWVGVDLFFVLSGFLVSGLLFTEYQTRGKMSLVRFYTRRGWKIYPPFFVFIAITVVAAWLQGRAIPRSHMLAEVLFLQSYLPGVWAHTWSLAVEEHFYLVLPLALLLIVSFNKRAERPFDAVLSLAVWISLATLATRVIHWYLHPAFTLLTHQFASHLRLDSLFFGVAISYVHQFHTSTIESLKRWRWFLLGGGFVLLTPAFIFQLETTPFIFTVGFTLFYVASGMILVGVLLTDVPQTRAVRFAAAIGACSYSIYLWHLYVLSTGVRLVERTIGTSLAFAPAAATYLIGSLAVGAFMAKAVEFPALRLRDRWFPRRDMGAIRQSFASSSDAMRNVPRIPRDDGARAPDSPLEEPVELLPPSGR